MNSSCSSKTIKPEHIAPCGMNCRLCWGYIREKNRCPGCRELGGPESRKSECRTSCRIKNCEHIAAGALKYCSERCSRFPCARLKQLDRRYRTRYGMSMLGNLAALPAKGIRAFVREEKEKWVCPGCGEMLCVHRSACLSCGYTWR
ncbi:DUF3795 domain-containing protein [bacterium]|nr:DUF3795 domain-containing protein [bacterium]